LRVYQLDQAYATSRKKAWPLAFKTALILVGLMWLIFIVNFLFPFIDFRNYGIYPRKLSGLTGIITAFFLHGSLSHLLSNTLPILLAITALFGNYPKSAKKVLLLSIFLTGMLVWSFARTANHIGASGVLYSLLTFIFISGFIKKDIQSIGISIVIAFLYGSLLYGLIPGQVSISWESHLFGFLVGIFLAWLYRNQDKPIYRSWDEEE
jgi:membrane associated rhomboid family serine protease